MRDAGLRSIDRRIARVRAAKLAGRVVYGAIALTMLACLLIHIDAVCGERAEALEVIVVQEDAPQESVIAPESGETLVSLGEEDYDLICRVVAAEARGEGHEGQLAVAQVIRDRARLWGMTPAEVVMAPGQFAAPYQGEIGAETRMAVNDCLIQGESAFDQPVTHFAEISITPYWAEEKEVAGVIGNHRFYR